MKNLIDKNLLIDAEVWVTAEWFTRLSQLIKPYNYIAIASYPSIQDANLFECTVADGEFLSETFSQFIKKHQQIGDLNNWIYISQNLENIYAMQQNHMDCYFVNNGINDCMDICCAHEIRDVNDLQKILK